MEEVKKLTVRLQERDYNVYKFKLEASQLSGNAFWIQALYGVEIKQIRNKFNAQVISAVNKVGNNLNQIAHNLNIANNINALNETEYKKILLELSYIRKTLQGIKEEL